MGLVELARVVFSELARLQLAELAWLSCQNWPEWSSRSWPAACRSARKEVYMDKATTRGEALEKFGKICRKIEETMFSAKVPGASLGIFLDGEILSTGLGVTSVDNALPVDDQTLFQIGSITKTFVATVIMRLLEREQLSLDEPVKNYLDDLKLSDQEANDKLTLRNILTHTCGFTGDYFHDLGFGNDALAEIVKELKNLPQNYPLGKLFSYCNSGYYVAGRVIEAVTGKPFEAATRELVFDPLNMRDAFFFPWDVMTHRFAVGHHNKDGTTVLARPWEIGRSAHPAGGIVTNVRDLLKYAEFHCGDGTAKSGQRMLSQDSLRQMQEPGIQINPGARIGLSWFITSVGKEKLISHGGGTNGQICEMVIAPEKRLATVALTNAASGSAITGLFSKLVFEEFLGLAQEELPAIEVAKEAMQEYLGRYAGEISDVELLLEDGKIMMRVISKGGFPDRDSPPFPPAPPLEVGFVGEDTIAPTESRYETSCMRFLRDDDGEVTILQTGRLFRKTDH